MASNQQVPGAWNSAWDDAPAAAEVPQDEAAATIPLPTTTGVGRAPSPAHQGGNSSTPPIVIAVFGQTGTGKTSFIKAVTGKDLQVGHSLTSCTEDVLPVTCQISGQNVILVDTPGFSDTYASDTEILRRIATWMKDTYDDGLLLSGIIYLHRIMDIRMENPARTNLLMMKKLCGTNALQNVVLATTMWERVSEPDGLRREGELKSNFWKDMISGGAGVTRIRTEHGADARDLVKSLLSNQPRATTLQEELHSGMTLVQTEAGTEIMRELGKLEQRLKAEHQANMAELRTALGARDRELARALQADMAERDSQIAKLEAEKKELQNLRIVKLPKARREGFLGLGGYHCQVCDRKTTHQGRWTCKSCNHKQRNMW